MYIQHIHIEAYLQAIKCQIITTDNAAFSEENFTLSNYLVQTEIVSFFCPLNKNKTSQQKILLTTRENSNFKKKKKTLKRKKIFCEMLRFH